MMDCVYNTIHISTTINILSLIGLTLSPQFVYTPQPNTQYPPPSALYPPSSTLSTPTARSRDPMPNKNSEEPNP